jgi:hypothetical protein
MKKGIFLSLILFFAMTFNMGCDSLDVTKDIELEIEFHAMSAVADFTAAELLDADSLSSVIEEYSNLIKDIEVKEVTFQITAVDNSNTATKINSSTLTVADESGAGEKTITTIANQDIVVMPVPATLTLDPEGVTRFEDLIKNNPHRALIRNTGSADAAPVDFTVKFVFKVKMTANPL